MPNPLLGILHIENKNPPLKMPFTKNLIRYAINHGGGYVQCTTKTLQELDILKYSLPSIQWFVYSKPFGNATLSCMLFISNFKYNIKFKNFVGRNAASCIL